MFFFFFFQAEDGIRDLYVTGVQTCALPISLERPVGTLLDQLAKLGIAPEDIKIVVNTHLHADHCGWNTRRLPDGRAVPTFPNARYLFQKEEWEAAIHPDELVAATYLAENLD